MASFVKSAMDRLTGGGSSAASSSSSNQQQPLSSDEDDDYPQHATNPTLHGHGLHFASQQQTHSQQHDDDSGTSHTAHTATATTTH